MRWLCLMCWIYFQESPSIQKVRQTKPQVLRIHSKKMGFIRFQQFDLIDLSLMSQIPILQSRLVRKVFYLIIEMGLILILYLGI